MKKVDLPISVIEHTPMKPDFKWGIKMLWIITLFIAFSYYLLFIFFSKVVLLNISLETEKKWFWEITKNQKFNYNEYIDYNIKEFKNFNFRLDESKEVNAYALIWGNININKGLLENIVNQEELVFIMSHEMWHIINRDSLKVFSTEFPMRLMFYFLWFDSWIWELNILDIWTKGFLKNNELEADKQAISILDKYNINPLCVKAFFNNNHNLWDSMMEMFSNHPLNSSRIYLLDKLAQKKWFININNCKKFKSIVE